MRLCKSAAIILTVVITASPLASLASWTFTMPDTVRVSGGKVTLSLVSTTELPAEVASLVVANSGLPGTTQLISRRGILRQLVTEGMAAGVCFKGSSECYILRTGTLVEPHSLRPEIRRIVQPFVPTAENGAPVSWFELQLPNNLAMAQTENFQMKLARTQMLEPGRNHLSIEWVSDSGSTNFPVTVILHHFKETATARLNIRRGQTLLEDLFVWNWTDLAGKRQKTDLFGRENLVGVSCARTITAGDYLRQCDLKPTPVIYSGDMVQLEVQRGSILVTVKAMARKEGAVGQTIPVLNELTKRLVNARVVAPGIVKWRN